MFDFTQTQLTQAVVHRIGNKARTEGYIVSQKPIQTDTEIVQSLLLKYFLSPFKGEHLFNFSYENEVGKNDLFVMANEIFENPDTLYENSIKIAQLLYEKSEHPKIKAGELYVAYLKDCVLEDELADVIGIFKSETKETYIKVEQNQTGFDIRYDNGININNLDKGCLIFNIDKEDGFVLSILDATSKGSDAVFWKDDFLKVSPRKDYHFYTQNYLTMCKDFIKEVHEPEEKTEITEMQQKTVQFFAEEEQFDIQKFEEEVLVEPEKITAFKEYKERYQEEKETPPLPEDFKISTPALKTAKKQFKNLIKLDSNFQISVLNPNGIITRGFDEQTGQRYYQLFFDEEK
ncbi:MAG: nucleoid-associated protein [Bacteroidia bacterium]